MELSKETIRAIAQAVAEELRRDGATAAATTTASSSARSPLELNLTEPGVIALYNKMIAAPEFSEAWKKWKKAVVALRKRPTWMFFENLPTDATLFEEFEKWTADFPEGYRRNLLENTAGEMFCRFVLDDLEKTIRGVAREGMAYAIDVGVKNTFCPALEALAKCADATIKINTEYPRWVEDDRFGGDLELAKAFGDLQDDGKTFERRVVVRPAVIREGEVILKGVAA